MPDWIIKRIIYKVEPYLDSMARFLDGIYHTECQLPMLEFIASNDERYVMLKKSDFDDWFGWDSEQKKQSVPKTDLGSEIAKWEIGIERLANSMGLEGEDYK